ncbi:uncharacterized protein LOC113774154 [Coffea eugenioides]|uniref:ATP-dependent DNA helicase n=1 Tax=Coffea arabica TaxID=13443 RepID=A0A6P6T252_COFAR|nr:uncharacterized protein LOC113696813 [Coffea arabica]XP_027174522.1 uncharacterized protein LOC113774154 [Coffea eugenioides]
MDLDLPFGGKVIIFGRDFRQTILVIQQAPKGVLIESSLPNSPLWSKLHKLRLTKNMRAMFNLGFSEFLLRVGEGRELVNLHGDVTLLTNMGIPYHDKEKSLNWLIQSVFSDLELYSQDPYSMRNKCILTAKNTSIDEVNDIMIRRFPGNLQTYISSNKTIDKRHQGNYEDLLNSQNRKGPPPHKLLLKKNCPIILMRNLYTIEGLCNGRKADL